MARAWPAHPGLCGSLREGGAQTASKLTAGSVVFKLTRHPQSLGEHTTPHLHPCSRLSLSDAEQAAEIARERVFAEVLGAAYSSPHSRQ